MGGYGSGRTGWKGKVEDCRTLDVNRLSKEGCLQPGNRASLAWTVDGEQVASIGLRAEADRLILNYRVGRNGEDWTDVEEAVPLARSPCRFGGMRTYFVCPGVEERAAVPPSREQALPAAASIFSAATATIWRTPVRAKPAPTGSSAVPTNASSHWAESLGPLCFRRSRKACTGARTSGTWTEIDAAEEQGLLAFLTGRRWGRRRRP